LVKLNALILNKQYFIRKDIIMNDQKNNTRDLSNNRERLREFIRKGQTVVIKDGKLFAPKNTQELNQKIQEEEGVALQIHDCGFL